jgi:hypothetical protein
LTLHSSRSKRLLEQARVDIADRLHRQRDEIDQTIAVRARAIGSPARRESPEYLDGIRGAVSAALDYGISAVRFGEDGVPPIPGSLISQAHIAARNGIGIDTVLRRYFAGYAVLADFLMHELQRDEDLPDSISLRLTRSMAVVFDDLVARISEEYERENQGQDVSADRRLAKRVRKLLAGELVDPPELNYDFEAHHIGVVASGSDATAAVHVLAKATDSAVMLVRPTPDLIWAWLGSRRRGGDQRLAQHLSPDAFSCLTMGIGESGRGAAGWRLTHSQATAAYSAATRSPGGVSQYGDVALLASMLQDDTLSTSLSTLYLQPLERSQDGGATLRATLRAYFACGRNAASAAAALGVSRQTVANRLRAIERHIGRPIAGCVSGLEAAMLLADSYESAGHGMRR